MRFSTHTLLIALVLAAFPVLSHGQQIINEYARIDSIISRNELDVDSLVVDDGSKFRSLDTVLFIGMRGALLYTPDFIPDPTLWGDPYQMYNTGIYSIQLVDTVINNLVVLATSLRDTVQSLREGEMAQLVRIPGGEITTLSGNYTCQPWDPATGTGGVFAILSTKKINLQDAVIDVTGKGFKGGDPSGDNFQGGCITDTLPYLKESAGDTSGRRGESIYGTGFEFTRGNGFAANGGGAGNGGYSGGGGGGGGGAGGQGGQEVAACSPVTVWGGRSGRLENSYYSDNRFFLGGGGGSGTQTLPDREATPGGNGGGIIIIITDTLASLGSDTIRADGETVTAIATGGAGGGGGGGMIVSDVENYTGNVQFFAEGGDGGNTDADVITGPGGFGGGGIIWHKFTSLPDNVDKDVGRGINGVHVTTGSSWGATNTGSSGRIIPGLNIQIRGFLFNIMPFNQDVCQDIRPDTIWASFPKGGDGTFSYRWQQSNDLVNWSEAGPAPGNQVYFAPDPLLDTTHYRRIVTSGETVDTSLIHTINVLPRLTNNLIADDDTVCMAGSPVPLVHAAAPVGGGNGVDYDYHWEESADEGAWTEAGGVDTLIGYAPAGLLDTTYFRRILTSHVCSDTSNTVTITVLDSLRGNTLYRDTSICQFTRPDAIEGDPLSGGQPGDYRFRWDTSSNNKTWSMAGVYSGNYAPGSLDDTVYYRRILYSGSQDACIDTSNTVTIVVHETIKNNNVQIFDEVTMCAAEQASEIGQGAGTVSGGDGSYAYTWQAKTWLEQDWQDGSGRIDSAIYDPHRRSDTTNFRRLIRSGACRDTSNTVTINVHPRVRNNRISADQVICNFDLPEELEHDAPVLEGALGPGTYTFKWFRSSPGNDDFTEIPDSARIAFRPPRLVDTAFYKRMVISGACNDSSNIVSILVQDSIRNNFIVNAPVDSTCYMVPITLVGSAETGLTGGDRNTYLFDWIKSNDGSVFDEAPRLNELQDYATLELTDSAWYKRIVTSGVCSDTSQPAYVHINPRPTGEVIDSAYPNQCFVLNGAPVSWDVRLHFTGRPPYNFLFNDDVGMGTTVEQFDYPARDTWRVNRRTNDSAHYSFTLGWVTDANGCQAFDTGITGSATTAVYKIPVTVVAADTLIVCDSLSQLEAIKDVGLGTWSVAEGDGNLVFSNPNDASTSAETVFGITDSLHYKIYWTERNWECISRDSLILILYKQPVPAVAGIDSTVYFADTIRLYAGPPAAGVGEWTITSGEALIEDRNDPGSRVDLGGDNLDVASEYVFLWTVDNGTCQTVSDEVQISRRDIRRYEGFSPDNNNINDYFVIRGLDYADQWEISIFSRHGNLIRRINSDMNVPELQLWDGRLDTGEEVEDGTYYYVLSVMKGNRSYEYKGTFEVARNKR